MVSSPEGVPPSGEERDGSKKNIPAQKLYRKTGFVFCGETDMYGHSYFLCERILTNGLDEIEMHLTGTFPQVTG